MNNLENEKTILEEKLLKKMKQATYYKKKYQKAKNIIKEVREYIEKNTDNTNFLEVPSKELLEILDKGE